MKPKSNQAISRAACWLWLFLLLRILIGDALAHFPAASRGVTTAATQAERGLYLFTGEQIDPDLEMYYLRARYYQPGIGRFWNMDSFEGRQGEPLSLHKYLYTRADPINWTDPSGNDGILGASIGSSIAGSLGSMYNSGVSTVGFALTDAVRGVAEGKESDAIIQDYWFNTAVGLGIGLVVGRAAQFADELISAGQVSRRLHSLLRDYWSHSGGVSQQAAVAIIKTEGGFGLRIGSQLRGSRFDNNLNSVVISKADLKNGEINRIMLAEEIQHGLDWASVEASRALRRGLSNEEFHCEVFRRILDNHRSGKFQFLTTEDITSIQRIIAGLR